MKVTPVHSPADIKDTSTPEHVRTAKAVQAFNKGQSSYDKPQTQAPAPNQVQAQETAVADPNNISAEELSAVRAPQATETSDIHTEVSAEEAPQAESKPDPELERRFQKIAQQERALRAKIQQQNIKLKQREAELQKREEALKQTVQAPDLSNYVAKDRIKADALTVLEEAGVSFDEFTNQALNRQPTDPRVLNTINKLNDKIDRLEQEAQANKAAQLDQQKQSYQAAIKQIKADATALVNSDPEFETVKVMGAISDVVELIEKEFEATGNVLSVEEAAKEVENYLVDEGMKITQIEKIRKRMAAANASQPKPEKKPLPTQQPQKTLTNATSSSRPLTARERSILAFEGKLKT